MVVLAVMVSGLGGLLADCARRGRLEMGGREGNRGKGGGQTFGLAMNAEAGDGGGAEGWADFAGGRLCYAGHFD